MKIFIVTFVCCIISCNVLTVLAEEQIEDDFKILKGDESVHDDEDVRVFAHTGNLSKIN